MRFIQEFSKNILFLRVVSRIQVPNLGLGPYRLEYISPSAVVKAKAYLMLIDKERGGGNTYQGTTSSASSASSSSRRSHRHRTRHSSALYDCRLKKTNNVLNVQNVYVILRDYFHLWSC